MNKDFKYGVRFDKEGREGGGTTGEREEHRESLIREADIEAKARKGIQSCAFGSLIHLIQRPPLFF